MTVTPVPVENPLDPLGDAERLSDQGVKRNFAKVGSNRPSSLLYTYGPGAVMDLPQFTIMPAGLDDWDVVWARRDGVPEIHAPRLRDAVRQRLRSRDLTLRHFPWQPKKMQFSDEGNDLGVPARVFPQWMRCKGCDMLAPLCRFSYRNTHPFRTDEACFEHERCTGKGDPSASKTDGKKDRKPRRQTAVPARYLLACVNGHLDEFPYDLWVHRGAACASGDEFPTLQMIDGLAGKGAAATIRCASCGLRRPMNEAQGEAGRQKLPPCRGRHPHLDQFDEECGNETHLMLVGASNLWFAASESIIVMPDSPDEARSNLVDAIRLGLGERLVKYRDNLEMIRDLLVGVVDVTTRTDAELADDVAAALATDQLDPDAEPEPWDPVDLLVPEWQYLQRETLGRHHQEEDISGLVLSSRSRGSQLAPEIQRVLAIEQLRKVNALLGFTRIDDLDRVDDVPARLVPLTRGGRPLWTVATEDRGEGIYIQLSEDAVASWEARVLASSLWSAHRESHRRNFQNRFSETAADVNPDTRLRPPRYWLVHTLAHVLIREMAMSCGYSAASLSERLYAWNAAGERPAAAGLIICTTASDSDGTLGGLVQLSEPDRLERIVASALYRAQRCSSDPVCAMRTPKPPEDFLHGAACHCCAMASETSCERANRFLDRRFLLDLPGSDLGFFDVPRG